MHLLLLPGLGADHRLLEPQRAAVPDLIVPPWLRPGAREPLPHYAQRLAGSQRWPDPILIGGVSFGGIVACELSRHLRASAVVLIASCTSPRALALHLRASRRLAPALPVALLHNRALGERVARHMGARDDKLRQLFCDMAAAAEPDFLRWALWTIARWQGAGDVGVPVRHIHGAEDRIIPARLSGANVIVNGAGHLLNVTRADEVNQFLLATMRDFESGARDGGSCASTSR